MPKQINNQLIYNRKEYLNGEIHHREYYAQFVNANLRDYVRKSIGRKLIVESKDESFNDIPLDAWDSIAHTMRYLMNTEEFKYASDSKPGFINWSLSDGICIAKTAASIIRDLEKNKVK